MVFRRFPCHEFEKESLIKGTYIRTLLARSILIQFEGQIDKKISLQLMQYIYDVGLSKLNSEMAISS